MKVGNCSKQTEAFAAEVFTLQWQKVMAEAKEASLMAIAVARCWGQKVRPFELTVTIMKDI